MAARYTCPACGREATPEQRFCVGCGSALALTCASCSHTNPPGSRFCGRCGEALGTAAPEAAAAEGSRQEATEERKLATVVFADISGFTQLSEHLDPDDVHALVKGCMAKLGTIAERYGGYVDKVIGDALMAVFGAPRALGDDAERAVRAALEMQRCAVENAADFGDLALRVGVNTGEVMFAALEAGGRETVVGDAVNTAQRIQSQAPTGGVLVGEETFRATRAAIRYEDLPPIVAKGKERPLEVWLALEARAMPVEPHGYVAPLVGRDVELGQLRLVWQAVSRKSRPQLVTVFGPPGIGKTRLARTFADHVAREGGRTLRGRSLPYGESTGYGALGQQVKELAEILETDPTPLAREKLEKAVARLLAADEAPVVGSHLAILLGLTSEGVADRETLYRSVRRFAEALARLRPTALVFEDVHWADPSLLDLLDDLERIADVPLLLLTLARPELTEVREAWAVRWQRKHRYLALSLDPLSPDESRELALHLLAQRAPVADDVAERLTATAEGNPLFIEELAASVAEHAAESAAELPTTVREIISARLDSLPSGERSVIVNASVVGKVFWRGALERMGADPRRLPGLLEELVQRDLIRREPVSNVAGDDEFAFKHMLIREVAYATLPKQARRERHAAVARFIEEGAGDRVEESAGILAYHWREAGEPGRAANYLLAAAEHAGRARAKSKAEEFFAEALTLIPEEEVSRWRAVLLRRALLWVELGAYHDAIAELEPLLPDLEGRKRFDALLARAQAAFWLTDAESTRRYGEEAHALAKTLGDDQLLAEVHSLLAALAGMDGDVEGAVELGERALELWGPGARSRQVGSTHEWAAIENYWLGRYPASLERARLAYELGKEFHNVPAWINGGAHIGLALAGLGRHEEALTTLERVAGEGRELELQPRFTARLTNIWAGVLRELYELDRARTLNEGAVEDSERAHFPGGELSGRIDLLVLDIMIGEVGRAEVAWPRLWERAEASKGWHQWLWIARLAEAKAQIELVSGRPEQALEQAARSIDHAERYRRLKYVVASRLALGSALLELGRRGEAVSAFDRALGEAEGLGHPLTIWKAAAGLARAAAAAGEDAKAEAAARRAKEALDVFVAALSDQRREHFLEAAAPGDLLASLR